MGDRLIPKIAEIAKKIAVIVRHRRHRASSEEKS
jgi:hypothetical protein